MEPQNITNIQCSSTKFDDIFKFIPKERKANSIALALLDFDDTLINSGSVRAGCLGGVKWRRALKNAIESISKRQSIHNSFFSYITLYLTMALKADPLDSELPEAVSSLIQNNFMVMLFTARGKNNWNMQSFEGVDALTEKQLTDAGFKLAEHNQLPSHDAIVKGSMIFCSYARKNIILGDLFAKKVFDPKQVDIIIQADDRTDSFDENARLAKTHFISYVGFNFTAISILEESHFDLAVSTMHLVNLFAKGSLLDREEERQEFEKFRALSIAPDKYFESALILIHTFFDSNKLFKEYRNVDDFFKTVSQVALDALHVPSKAA